MTTIDINTILSLPTACKVDLIETLEQIIMDYREFKRPLDFTIEAALEAIEVAPSLSNVEAS